MEDFERGIRHDNNLAVLKDGREDFERAQLAFHDGTDFWRENLHERHQSLFQGTEYFCKPWQTRCFGLDEIDPNLNTLTNAMFSILGGFSVIYTLITDGPSAIKWKWKSWRYVSVLGNFQLIYTHYDMNVLGWSKSGTQDSVWYRVYFWYLCTLLDLWLLRMFADRWE